MFQAIILRESDVKVAYYFAPIANGMGDLIVSLPALEAVLATGQSTYLILRSPNQFGLSDRIEGLSGIIQENNFSPDQLGSSDVFINLRAHPLQSDYIWGSSEFEAKYPGYRINDVLSGICRDWNIDADFSNVRPLRFETINQFSETIAFIPGSVGEVKCWPSKHWIKLAKLLSHSGLKITVVGQPERSGVVGDLVEAGLDHVSTPNLTDALDVVSNAKAVVAVDTGLMHMAVTQKTPTVALFRYNTMFFRPYEHTEALTAPLCPTVCREREYQEVPNKMLTYDVWNMDSYTYWKTWNCAESEDDRCMTKIRPEVVVESVERLMEASSRGA